MAQALNNETGTANGEDDMSVYGGNKGVPVERDNDDDAFLRGLMLIHACKPSDVPTVTLDLTHNIDLYTLVHTLSLRSSRRCGY